MEIPTLGNAFPDHDASYPNVRWAASNAISQRAAYANLIDDHHVVLHGVVCRLGKDGSCGEQASPGVAAYVRAGPRAQLHFSPPEVCAAIITAGGLAPGSNDVVRSIVKDLHDLYGVASVIGVRYVTVRVRSRV